MHDEVVVAFLEVASEHFCLTPTSVNAKRGATNVDDEPSPPMSRSMTEPTRTLMTPRKPWSFFLNFFWSNICTANILSSDAFLSSHKHSSPGRITTHGTYMSNDSFQYGLRVFLMTEVVLVCSPPSVATANGSGKPRETIHKLAFLSTAVDEEHTEDITFVETIGGDYCHLVSSQRRSKAVDWLGTQLVTLRFSRLQRVDCQLGTSIVAKTSDNLRR